VHAVADRNLAALEQSLSVVLREGTSPVTYLRALQRYFNRLYSIQSQVAQGMSADNVIANLKPKVFYKHVPILTRHVQQWSAEAVVKALRLLIAAELACKTSDLPPVPASSRRLLQVTQAR
jgi:DNA polymerase III delta subunit